MLDIATWLEEQVSIAWWWSQIPCFTKQPLTHPRKVTMLTTIPIDPKRIAFEEWLRDRFKVRALDLMRKPGRQAEYADPGIQFAYLAWHGGVEHAPFIESVAGGGNG